MKSLLIILMTIGNSVMAANKTPNEQSEDFFSRLMESKFDLGFERLVTGSALERRDPEKLKSLKLELTRILKSCGDPISYKCASYQSIGDTLHKTIYIVNYAEFPLIWTFYFYKPGNEWHILSLNCNDNVTVL